MHALRAITQFSRRGPSLFAVEPVAGQILESPSGSAVPDAQALLSRVSRLSSLLASAPQVALQKDPVHTLCDAIAVLARFLLDPERIFTASAHTIVLGARRWAVVVSIEALPPAIAWQALTLARELLASVDAGDVSDVTPRLKAFKIALAEAAPDDDHAVLVSGARKTGVPMMITPQIGHLQFGWGVKGRTLQQLLPARLADSSTRSAGCSLLVADGRLVAATSFEGMRSRAVLGRVPPALRERCEALAKSQQHRVAGFFAASLCAAETPMPEPAVSLAVHARGGCDAAALGESILGGIVGRIPVAVAIGPEAEVVALDASWRKHIQSQAMHGTGVCGASAARGVLLDPRLKSLLVCTTPEELLGAGVPIDACDLAILIGEPSDARTNELMQHVLTRRKMAKRSLRVRDAATALDAAATFQATPSAVPAVRAPAALPQDVRVLKSRTFAAGPTLFALMRNEAMLLPHFLAHYRKLGVENFVFYDDGSTDGGREMLEREADCTIVTSSRRFDAQMPDGRSFHQFLKEIVPECLAPDRWVLGVDLDEFLMLPPGFDTLEQFQKALDELGYESVFATMVDAHPARLADRNYPASLSPLEGSPYFDVERGFRRRSQGFPEKTLNGVRGRLVQTLRQHHPEVHHKIFAGRGYLMPALHKVPLVRTGRGISRMNSHTINRQPPAHVEVALAHFKFGPDLDAKIADALAGSQHYLGSIEYQFLDAAIRLLGDHDLRYEGTRRFDDPGALAAAGLVRFDP